jgi:hypothetical protein
MEQFAVPQFIDVENKIIGPITTRQFLIMVVGAFFGFIAYTLADFGLFVFLAVIDVMIVGLFAFFKVNGVPLHFFFLNVLQTTKRPKTRVWNKYMSIAEIKAQKGKKKEEKEMEQVRMTPRRTTSSLAELSLIVDTGGDFKGTVQ